MAKEVATKSPAKPTKPRKSMKKYFREVLSEMKKVSWPNRKELTKFTVAVVVLIIALSIVVGIVDLGLGKLMNLIVG